MALPVHFDAPVSPGLSAANDTPEARKEVAKQFEALLLGELMKAMRATASVGEEEGDAFARGSYEEMFDRALVESSAGGLGIAALFERQAAPPIPGESARNQAHRRAESLLSAASDAASNKSREAATHMDSNHMDSNHMDSNHMDSNHMDSNHMDSNHNNPRTGIGSSFDAALPQAGLWPVDGGVQSSDYGFRTHPIHGDRRFHTGLDIAAPEGREIRAVQEGVVTYAERHKGYGNMVEITHPDGIVTRYAHASRLHVRKGDVVDVGETIADVGSTGQSTGPHLHFEVRDGHRRLNPESYLERLRADASHGDPSGVARPRTGVTALARDVNADIDTPEDGTP
jgi:YD repeat-containing protein